MKLVTIVVAGGVALAWSIGAMAADKPKRHKSKAKVAHHRVVHKKAVRPAGDCGLRNQGTPIAELNFKNPCDQNEFWMRMQERGGNDGP